MPRDGMPLCKYLYRDFACAHHKVESVQCLGFDQCGHFVAATGQLTGTPSVHLSGASHRWLGLYCETHQRFDCETRGPCRPTGLRASVNGAFSVGP